MPEKILARRTIIGEVQKFSSHRGRQRQGIGSRTEFENGRIEKRSDWKMVGGKIACAPGNSPSKRG